jgi:UDP-2-acetamido-2,6-beta-L-arabino-hexul-4-ose reductase
VATLKTILVTGSGGFLGKNLIQTLSTRDDIRVIEHEVDDSRYDLDRALRVADVVVHLAGVNRPQGPDEYMTGNIEFTKAICDTLCAASKGPKIVMSSSIQAELDNPYGVSKRLAEKELEKFADESGAEVVVFRFKNIFGKWSRPNYNSVVATFCHNIARDLPITVTDPNKRLELIYVDDVVAALLDEIDSKKTIPGFRFAEEIEGFAVMLGDLAETIRAFRESRTTCRLPEFSDRFTACLYATYLSYLDDDDLAYDLEQKTDARGALAEFVKSPHIGQVFVSRTKPGITRGNHYHHTKVEKFFVVEGAGVVHLRHLRTGEMVEMKVCGEDFRVVDIPPGYTHSIQNVGSTDMVVIFWASEVFDPNRPDTYYCEVRQ